MEELRFGQFGETETQQCPWSRDPGPSSQAAPGKGPEHISFPGARGVSSCLLPRSASCSEEVMNTTNPNDITKHQTHSYPSSLASAPKIRLLHISHWHHLVYNLGPRILANLEVSLVWQPKEKISLLGCFCLQRPGSICGGFLVNCHPHNPPRPRGESDMGHCEGKTRSAPELQGHRTGVKIQRGQLGKA